MFKRVKSIIDKIRKPVELPIVDDAKASLPEPLCNTCFTADICERRQALNAVLDTFQMVAPVYECGGYFSHEDMSFYTSEHGKS